MPVTEKISVTIGRKELGHAKRLASRLGVSLSGFITEAVGERIREQERREAALEVLASFSPGDRATPGEAQALLALWGQAIAPAAKRRGARSGRAPGGRKGR